MKKDHSKKWQKFNDMCQRLGDTPQCRIFLPDSVVSTDARGMVKANDPSRSIIFTLSTPGVKRDGHEIVQDGWHIANYRNNPVVMWAHGRDTIPLANSVWEELQNVKGIGKSLRSEASFLTAEDNPFAEQVLRLLNKGVLNAVSVGWRTLKYDYIRDQDGFVSGLRFTETDLLEYSVVPVPADPSALQAAFNDGSVRSDFYKNFDTPVRDADIFYIGDPEPELDERQPKIFVDLGSLPEKTEPEIEDNQRDLDLDLERGVISYEGYGPADRNEAWDGSKARKQLRDFATGDNGEIDYGKYGRGFLFSGGDGKLLGDFKGPHHYVQDGGLVTVWRGVVAAAQRLQQGAFDVPMGAISGMKNHIARHYKQFNETAPWERAIGRMYEQIYQDLKNENLSDEEVATLRATAESLSKQIYGEFRINESWENPYSGDEPLRSVAFTLDKTLAEFETNEDCRTERVKELMGEIEKVIEPLHNASIVLRTVFEITKTENSDQLLERLAIVEPEEVKIEVEPIFDHALERLSQLLGSSTDAKVIPEETEERENISENTLTLFDQLDTLFKRITDVSPVAGENVGETQSTEE